MGKVIRQVLVLEDDVMLQTQLTQILYRIDASLEMTWVKSAEEAWMKMLDSTYDLIIADVMLEGEFTGVDFWRTLAKGSQDTPLVLMSACSEYEVLQAIDSAGKDLNLSTPAFLPKPLRLGECRQVLEGLLRYSA